MITLSCFVHLKKDFMCTQLCPKSVNQCEKLRSKGMKKDVWLTFLGNIFFELIVLKN